MDGPATPLRLLSYDLDGTLVDTLSEIAEAVNLTLDDLGLARRSEAEIATFIGKGTRELMLGLLARIAIEAPAQAAPLRPDAVLAGFDRRYAETAGRWARPYPGCADSLRQLEAAGVLLVCVTNKEQHHAERVLATTGLAPHFKLLIGGDTFAFKKPDARVLAHVLDHFGVAPADAAHVGDSWIDIEAARNAGVAAWVLPHGYNGGRPIADCGPDRVFDGLRSVAEAALLRVVR